MKLKVEKLILNVNEYVLNAVSFHRFTEIFFITNDSLSLKVLLFLAFHSAL